MCDCDRKQVKARWLAVALCAGELLRVGVARPTPAYLDSVDEVRTEDNVLVLIEEDQCIIYNTSLFFSKEKAAVLLPTVKSDMKLLIATSVSISGFPSPPPLASAARE